MSLPGWCTPLLLAAGLLAGCSPGDGGGTSEVDYASAGERIYFTGTGARGRRIPHRGGSVGWRLRARGCADCHGADRRGGRRMIPEFWRRAPPITPPALFAPGATGYPPYDPVSLRQAIRDGVGGDGRALAGEMPRWEMTDLELSELVFYLGGF